MKSLVSSLLLGLQCLLPSALCAARAITGDALADLPLVEVVADGPGPDLLVVLISGDGGWASIDRELAATLSAAGLPVIGLDARKYFGQPKTVEQSGRTLGRIIARGLASTGKQSVLLVGFSRGADVLPFMINRLPEDLRARVAQLVLIAPSAETSLEVHLWDALGASPSGPLLEVLPELRSLSGMPILCLYGSEDPDCIGSSLPDGLATVISIAGGHHLDGDYARLGQLILDHLPQAGTSRP